MELPGFEILDQISEDSKATVWKAHQTALNRMVSIRVLKETHAKDEEQVKRFIEPARMAAKLKHPNLIQIYDVSEQNDTYYAVMEYIDGMSLSQMIKVKGPLPLKRTLDIAAGMTDALAHAWDKAYMVHRNLKPDNIMVDAGGTVKIADIGMAMASDPASPEAHRISDEIEGTPEYMSPEQIEGNKRLTCRSDMYALGAVLYHTVTGKAPFAELPPEQILQQHLHGRLPHPQTINATVNPGMARLIERLMMKDPMDRPKDWKDVLLAIDHVRTGKTPFPKPDSSEISTITPAAAQKKIRPVSPLLTPPPPSGPPWLLKLVAAMALMLFWIGLAAWRLDMLEPTLKTLQTRFFPAEPEHTPDEPPVETVVHPGTASPDDTVVLPEPVPEEDEEAPHHALTETGERLPDATTPSQPIVTAADMKHQFLQQLLEHDLSEADATLQMLQRRFPESLPAAEEALLLETLALQRRLPMLLAESFRDQLGRETTIQVNDRAFNVIPRTIAQEQIGVYLLRETANGIETNTITFTADRLAPADQAARIQPVDSDAKAVTRCLLFHRAGDQENAIREADRAGVLTPLLRQFLADAR